MTEPVNDDCPAFTEHEAAAWRILCCTLTAGHDGDHDDPVDGPWRVQIVRLIPAEVTP